LCCSCHAGWIKTRPAQKLLVRVKFTGNPYRTYRTRINVNSRHWNTCKLVFTGIRTRTRVSVNLVEVIWVGLSHSTRFLDVHAYHHCTYVHTLYTCFHLYSCIVYCTGASRPLRALRASFPHSSHPIFPPFPFFLVEVCLMCIKQL